jgi:lysophospholipase L1-like esterase
VTARKLSFYVIAIAIPFVFIALLELGLRLVGYGQSYPLFVPAPKLEQYLQPNPEIIKRFFHQHASAPNVAPDTVLFKKQKASDTKRIVLMGGSTAAGFPYGRFGSPLGLLHQQVKLAYPEEKIEFISVAMASINTYSILDFVDEVLAIEPDAVLIYAGHNEYLGVMGVGSSFASKGGHAANLAFLKLKDARIFQFAQNIYYSLFVEQAFEHKGNRTVMASVAKEKSIPLNSALYEAGKTQFSENLKAILTSLNQQGVATYISTIASNEAGQRPFESADTANTTALLKRSYELNNINPEQASLLSNADEKSANLAFMLAQKLEANYPQAALTQYLRANDLDELRFRAPSEFNKLIESLNSELEHVTLVDSLSAFRTQSENSIINNKLMLEHLHPNEAGYLLIAQSFFNVLEKATFFETTKLSNQQISINNNPILHSDNFSAQHKIKTLTSDYPFVASKQTVNEPVASNQLEKVAIARLNNANWIATQKQLIELYQSKQQWLNAGISAGMLFDALPFEHQSARAASLFYLRANQYTFAYYYAQRAYELNRQDANYGLTLAEVMFRLGMKEKSLSLLDKIISEHPNNAKAKAIRQQVS